MEKLNEQCKVIRLTPFPVNVWLVVTNNLEDSANNAFKNLGSTELFGEAACTAAATVYKWLDGNVYAIFKPNSTLTAIAHEMYHVVAHAARFTGVDDGEFMAHYVGWLTHEAVQFVNENNPLPEVQSEAAAQ